MKEDVRRTSGNQVRINIYWLIKGKGGVGKKCLSACVGWRI